MVIPSGFPTKLCATSLPSPISPPISIPDMWVILRGILNERKSADTKEHSQTRYTLSD